MKKLCNFTSDLVIETAEDISLKPHYYKQKGIDMSEIEIDLVASRKSGRKTGAYLTVSPTNSTDKDTLSDVLYGGIKKLVRKVDVSKGKVLVVGLGNENVIVDALGKSSRRYAQAARPLSSAQSRRKSPT